MTINRKFLTFFICVAFSIAPVQVFAQEEQGASLYAVFDAVLKNTPSLKAGTSAVDAAKGNALQAGMRPNPQASLEMENILGSGALSGTKGAEISIGLSQEVEIAGKRRLRREVADYSVAIAQQQATSEILSILAAAHQSYAAYSIAVDRLELAQKRLDLASQTHAAVKKRVRAAISSDIQHTKADIELKTAEIGRNKAEKDLKKAAARLERLSATDISQFTPDRNFIKTIPDIPAEEEFLNAVENLPQMRLLKLRELQARSTTDLAKSDAVPNPTFGLGVRRLNDVDENAFLASVSIPIPVFNRNQGQVREAYALRDKAEAEIRAGELVWAEAAKNVYTSLQTFAENVISYRDDIIPSAQKAYDQAMHGYNAGRFSFLEMLDAQRTLYEVRDDYLNSLLSLHEAKAQADFLTGAHQMLVANTITLSEGETK